MGRALALPILGTYHSFARYLRGTHQGLGLPKEPYKTILFTYRGLIFNDAKGILCFIGEQFHATLIHVDPSMSEHCTMASNAPFHVWKVSSFC